MLMKYIKELNRLLELLNQNLENDVTESLVRSCQGLSINDKASVIKSIANNQIIDSSSISIILKEKQQIINQTQILEFLFNQTLDQVDER